jgi:hypothetical protein
VTERLLRASKTAGVTATSGTHRQTGWNVSVSALIVAELCAMVVPLAFSATHRTFWVFFGMALGAIIAAAVAIAGRWHRLRVGGGLLISVVAAFASIYAGAGVVATTTGQVPPFGKPDHASTAPDTAPDTDKDPASAGERTAPPTSPPTTKPPNGGPVGSGGSDVEEAVKVEFDRWWLERIEPGSANCNVMVTLVIEGVEPDELRVQSDMRQPGVAGSEITFPLYRSSKPGAVPAKYAGRRPVSLAPGAEALLQVLVRQNGQKRAMIQREPVSCPA